MLQDLDRKFLESCNIEILGETSTEIVESPGCQGAARRAAWGGEQGDSRGGRHGVIGRGGGGGSGTPGSTLMVR